MKKVLVLFMVLSSLTLMAACSGESTSGSDYVHEITERFFAMQFFEMSMNSDDFIGRTIRYEGMFTTNYWEPTSEYFHFVYRYTDGCCGPVEPLGLEVYLGNIEPLADNAWVEVTGVLERFQEGGQSFLRLNVTSLIEKEERGSEFVMGLN